MSLFRPRRRIVYEKTKPSLGATVIRAFLMIGFGVFMAVRGVSLPAWYWLMVLALLIISLVWALKKPAE